MLITGAARGIGAETARQLYGRGAQLSIVGLEPEELERRAEELGSRAAWFEADVTDWDALRQAADATLERFGGIDVVIANAGVAPVGTVATIDPVAFERTIEVNLLGVWRTVRTMLPHVVERRGYVLIVASVSAPIYAPGMSAYTASKAGVEAFANALRLEVAHLGVDVGVLYPFWIATDLLAGGDAHPAFGFARAKLAGPIGKTHPVSKVGEAVAEGIERRSRWITVPRWIRAVLLLRGLLFPLFDAGGRRDAAEMDERFERDRQERGAEASAPIGPGGAAVREGSLDRG